MAQEVGVAYVTLLPSGKGFGRAVEGQVDDALGKSEKKTDGFFSKVGKGVKNVALGVAGVATGVAALAVTGGISRALNIEDAQAKLKGLGHDTQSVEAIMKDALASVKGTAFGLDAAATTAAAAVASGIKPGKELEGYLRLTADAATIAGVSMEEMGSIMNKVQAKGKAQMEDLNRLTERGIPIMQMLADEYGVTAEEMSKMVSKGEVDAERFRAALEKNIGGAALESGNTTRGAFKNMMAALSRLGLVFVEDGVAGAKTFFNEVTVILDGIAQMVKPWVASINEALGGAFTLDGFGDRFLAGFDRLVSAISSGPIPQLIASLAPALPALEWLAITVGESLGQAFRELGAALVPILPLISEKLVYAVRQLTPSLGDFLVAVIPLIPSLVELTAALVPLVVAIIDGLLPAIKWLAGMLANEMTIFNEFVSLLRGNQDFAGITEALFSLEGPLGDLYRWLADGAVQVGYWAGVVRWTLTEVAEWVGSVLNGIRDYFATTWETIGLTLGGALQVIWGLISGNMQLVTDGIAQGLGAIGGWWSTTWGGLASFLTGVWASISGAVSGGISNVVGVVQSLPGRIMAALSVLPGLLVGVGQQMIQGLINGVSSMVSQAVAAVKNVGGQMLDGVKSFLGIKSPSRRFRDEVGKMVGLGLLEGIEDQSIRGRIDSAVNHLVEIPGGTSAGGVTVYQDNTFNAAETDDRLLMIRAGRYLKEALS